MKILIVENERKVAQFVAQALNEQSYTTFIANSCRAARDALAESPYDAIVLDLGLDDGDGLDLLSEWRRHGFHEPVLILSARDAVQDRVRGLNLGAVARVRSLLRRHSAGSHSTVLTHGDLRIDLLARTVTQAGVPIELTSREFALTELFLHNVGRVLTRTLIAEKIWDAPYDLGTNLIDVYVRRIRQKLEREGGPALIKTIRGTGYQLV